jgi:hypothetical protein
VRGVVTREGRGGAHRKFTHRLLSRPRREGAQRERRSLVRYKSAQEPRSRSANFGVNEKRTKGLHIKAFVADRNERRNITKGLARRRRSVSYVGN